MSSKAEARAVDVANLVFVGEGFAGDRLATAEERASAPPGRLSGHFGLHRRHGPVHELVRDPLGVNKLFFAICDGDVESATFMCDLHRAGHPWRNIYSVPSGHALRIDPLRQELSLTKVAPLPFGGEEQVTDAERERHAETIRARLGHVFGLLARALEGRDVYVTMSGGLDSTVVSVLAKEHFPKVRGLTFHMRSASGRGDDLDYARRVADFLDVDLREVAVDGDELVSHLDDVLVYGQDWRDFNVHCGLVNAVLASAMPEGAVVLTGDTMNELVADYTPVEYAGVEHYGLPDLAPGKLRRFLVSGLDSGDREVGVFARHGVQTVQPYALVADAYTALPEAFLASDRAKQELVRAVMGERVPDFIYGRTKVRAQCASPDEPGGTLAALVDRGIDAAALAARFRELFGMDEKDLRRLVRAGFYRFPTSWPP